MLDEIEIFENDKTLRMSKFVKPELLLVFGPPTKFPGDATTIVLKKFIEKKFTNPFRQRGNLPIIF